MFLIKPYKILRFSKRQNSQKNKNSSSRMIDISEIRKLSASYHAYHPGVRIQNYFNTIKDMIGHIKRKCHTLSNLRIFNGIFSA